MGENIPFQIDVLFQNIAVAVRLGDESAALAGDKQGIFPVHHLDRTQAPAIVLIGPRRDSALGYRGQSLIIGQVVDRGVYAIRSDIARGIVAVGCRYRLGALVKPVKSIKSDPVDANPPSEHYLAG
ncbi:MAG: hypothetical protein WGN25_12680 [Candidatus Electrothrix sp. GW3-4]|uniref:hypothetical protein n=1 Tax=Candidatus Electrothrix sp. GW3-4 TaxID=3126740 RepID=UPI0030CAB5A6